jgi:hypothetical protein
VSADELDRTIEMGMHELDPDWTAPRHVQDWRDDELMLAAAWLKSFVPLR